MAYCKYCDKEVGFTVVLEDKEMTVKDMTFTLTQTEVSYCSMCNQEIFEETIDSRTQDRAFDEYRKARNLIYPQEIIEIRKQYGLNQKTFSKLLGFGEVTVARYENGSLPTKAQSFILKLIRDPHIMLKLIEENSDVLEPTEVISIKSRINVLLLSSE